MSGITPISGLTPAKMPAGMSAAAGKDASAEKMDFGRMLKDYITRVDQAQQSSATAIQEMLAGKSKDVLPVVAAVAKADLSFKLLMGIRNKVVEAYKQTMNMQV